MEQNKSGIPSASGTNERNFRLQDAKKKHKRRKFNNKVIAYCVVIIAVVISGWILFDKLFVVRNFKISGNAEYSDEQAANAVHSIGISEGDHIFGIDKKKALDEAKYRLSQFDSVSISYEMPDTVVLKVTEAVPVMYTVFGNNGYVLSEGLRVVSSHTDPSVCERMGLIRVDLDGITKCVAGEFLETDGEGDEILKKLYSVFKEEETASDVTAVDVTDKFNITFVYQNKFEVKLGDSKDFTVKIRYMKAIAGELDADDSGVIDVSDENHRDATFKPYNKM